MATNTGPRPAPQPRDSLDTDWLLAEEERQIQQAVRRYVQERVLPDIAHHYEEGTFPRDLIKEMADLGLLGMHLTG